MDLKRILKNLENCPCGRDHLSDIGLKAVEIGHGNLKRVPEILDANGFPKKILVVSDNNALRVSKGILDDLMAHGFSLECHVYPNKRTAEMTDVKELLPSVERVDGVLAVGTGSVDDVCRYSAALKKKPFAIFGTAPSMDGYASDTAPITDGAFKLSYQAKEPQIIIADTEILAAAPTELKSAGFGDMIAKCIGLVDWKISNVVSGEYYCDRIADLTREATRRIISMADKVTLKDEESAGAIMEALIFTGIAMKMAGSSRPGSGCEHIISHFWESKKLEQGLISDFHGKKVGVATLIVNRAYHRMAQIENVDPKPENVDWDEVKRAYGPNLAPDMMKLNSPTVTEGVDPMVLKEKWPEIRQIIKDELLPDDELLDLFKQAGAATTIEEIAVTPQLRDLAFKYHPFMRHRLSLMRLRQMYGFSTDYKDYQ